MKPVFRVIGRIVFWCGQPLLRRYVRQAERTRVVIRCGDRVLVVKDWIGSGRWHLPGGGMHADETPLQGAIREVREEVGLQFADEQFVYKGKYEAQYAGEFFYTYHLFYITVSAPLPLKLQAHEISDGAWLPIADVSQVSVATPTTCHILNTLD